MEEIKGLGKSFSERVTGNHFPALKSNEKVDYKIKDGRQYCIICKHDTYSYCQTCGVHFCLKKGVENQKDCWADFHSKRIITEVNKRMKSRK